MKEFINRLSTDKEFAGEFREFMTGQNAKVKEGTRLVGQQLDKAVMGSIKEFASIKGIELKDDDQISMSFTGLSKQICMQMNDMIVKSFTTVEGSMKQPVDFPQEWIQAIDENKELYLETLHKTDKDARATVEKCGKELNALIVSAFNEFAEKTGLLLPDAQAYAEMNKAISQNLNNVISTQIKGLMEISKTSAK